MNQSIAIIAASFISASGETSDEIWENYRLSESLLRPRTFNECVYFVGSLPPKTREKLTLLKATNSKYRELDPSVVMAILVAREAIKQANWSGIDFGINLGSSRGATHLFEKYHESFLQSGKADTLTSPTTTLGNISSWVANDIQNNGPTLSHSITCSTGLHAVLNGIAWLQAGLTENFMVGATEAPLTAFTLAQMAALKIYTKADSAAQYPCQAMNFEKNSNTMALGEGAGVLCLTTNPKPNQSVIARILGMGYATELLKHNTSISADGICFQKSMKMALKGMDPNEVDAIVLHAPGTIKGDLAELQAIKKVFPNRLPFMTNNKWKIGHTFAVSGILNIEMAIQMMTHQHYFAVPFFKQPTPNNPPIKILVNSVGFGGNAVSILIGK